MKAIIALLFVLVAVVSAQIHGSIGGGSIGRSGMGGGSIGRSSMGGHRMGRSIVGGPVLLSRPVISPIGAIGKPMGMGIPLHRVGRSVMLAPPAPIILRGGLMRSSILAPKILI